MSHKNLLNKDYDLHLQIAHPNHFDNMVVRVVFPAPMFPVTAICIDSIFLFRKDKVCLLSKPKMIVVFSTMIKFSLENTG